MSNGHPGRPRHSKRLPNTFPVILYYEDYVLYNRAEQQALLEGISLSNLFKKALAEYLSRIYPDLDKAKLFDETKLKKVKLSDTISSKIVASRLRDTIKAVERLPEQARSHVLKALAAELERAAKLYDRTQDNSLKELIERGERLLV
jgi:L-ribulose-5-phosphate 3-epimerase UlaE